MKGLSRNVRPSNLLADLPAFRTFAHEVQKSLTADELTYSNRLGLLARAKKLGIERFDANLVIAMVQHRAGNVRDLQRSRKRRVVLSSWMIVAGLQAVIVAAGWWILA